MADITSGGTFTNFKWTVPVLYSDNNTNCVMNPR